MDAADLVAELTRPWRHGEHVDARGIALHDPLVLDGLDVRGVDFSEAQLLGGIRARNARFRGLAWLRGARIAGPCDLTGAHFRIDFRGDGLTADDLRFDRCVFQGVLSLAGADLTSVSLAHALVMANLTMENAIVRETADLSDTEILGGLWTAHARIGRLVKSDVQIFGRVQMPALG